MKVCLASGWRRRLLGVLLLVAALSALLMFDEPLCPTAGLFGIPCPGCGLTRASLALLQGHFVQAYAIHPLVFLLLPFVGIYSALSAVGYVAGWSRAPGVPGLPRGHLPERRMAIGYCRIWTPVAAVLFVLMLALWVARFFGAFGGPAVVHPWWAERNIFSSAADHDWLSTSRSREGGTPLDSARPRARGRDD